MTGRGDGHSGNSTTGNAGARWSKGQGALTQIELGAAGGLARLLR
ncbi:hypothetical protein [Phyllobacterium sp. SB3]